MTSITVNHYVDLFQEITCVLRCGLIQGSADTYLMCNDRLGRLCTASVVIRDFRFFRSDRSVHIKTGFYTKKKRRVFPIGHAKCQISSKKIHV